MKRIVVALDSFKGSLSSQEAGLCVKEAFLRDREAEDDTEVCCVAVSDGGEGFCRIVTTALGGTFVECDVHDPLLRPLRASYGRAKMPGALFGESGDEVDGAVVDVASASGLTLLREEERDPWKASSLGTGELIRHALEAGIRHVVVGLGGSATNDCGYGLLEALKGVEHLDEVQFLVATDVESPLCGPMGAARAFARQKGADERLVERLEERDRERGKALERACGRRVSDVPGAGAAGGVGAALLSLPHARIVSGIQFVLEIQQFGLLLEDAALVVTGEGRIDRQTLLGKAPFVIGQLARQACVPCVALAGSVQLTDKERASSPWDRVECITPQGMSLEAAMKPEQARLNIRESVRRGSWYRLSR